MIPTGWIRDLVARAMAVVRKPGTPEPLPPDERERRAMAVVRGPTGRYGLGAGGRDPKAADPWGTYQPRKGEPAGQAKARQAMGRIWCDCSGAIAWVLGVPRRIPGYARGWGYLSTDGLIKDADDPEVELVRWVQDGAAIEPWTCLVVYGSQDLDGDGDRDSIGHVGIVAAVPDGWMYTGPESLAALSIWHCASSGSPTGAVRISDGRAWARRGRLVEIF